MISSTGHLNSTKHDNFVGCVTNPIYYRPSETGLKKELYVDSRSIPSVVVIIGFDSTFRIS